MYRNIELPSTKTIISTAASVAATAMVVRSFAKDIFPAELRQFFFNEFHQILSTLNNDMTIIIEEFEGLNKNHLFHAAEIYMGTIISPSTRSFRASLPEKEKKINVSVGRNEDLVDKFDGVQLQWTMVTKKTQPRYVQDPDGYNTTMKCEVKQIMLKFHKKHKTKVIDEYFPYVLKRSKAIEEEKKTVKLHTLNNDRMHPRIVPWQSVNLDHPAKFETLAMDDEIKNMIIDDLDRFVARKEFYRKVGKAWKRGYLLFGPPGTGKSSLIAAMANYLNFDVYDLELTDLRCNSDLRRLLISTANRSILVVEDIDASIDLTERKKTAAPKTPPQMNPFGQYTQTPKVTLSGLLNFIDGLWSSCGDERIIIFTTNHKEKLDPALLRPGRMDVHIHMSYCTPCGFKMLVSNYLSITEPHPLALEAQRLIASTKVTPAEIAEQLLKSDNPEITLTGLVEFLQDKKESERTGREKLEVTKREVLLDIENDGMMDMKIVKGPENYGIQELIKMVKESPVELRKNILNKNEIPPNDLRFLIGFLEGELENKSVKGFEALARVQKTE